MEKKYVISISGEGAVQEICRQLHVLANSMIVADDMRDWENEDGSLSTGVVGHYKDSVLTAEVTEKQ